MWWKQPQLRSWTAVALVCSRRRTLATLSVLIRKMQRFALARVFHAAKAASNTEQVLKGLLTDK